MVEGDEYIEQLIGLALCIRRSSNPFESEGLENITHNLQGDPGVRARLLLRAKRLFERLERKRMARLVGAPLFYFDDNTSRQYFVITWVSLETERTPEQTRQQPKRTAYEIGSATPIQLAA